MRIPEFHMINYTMCEVHPAGGRQAGHALLNTYIRPQTEYAGMNPNNMQRASSRAWRFLALRNLARLPWSTIGLGATLRLRESALFDIRHMYGSGAVIRSKLDGLMEAALHPRAVLRPLYEGVDHRWTIPQDAPHMWLLVLVTRIQRLSSPSARSPYAPTNKLPLDRKLHRQ